MTSRLYLSNIASFKKFLETNDFFFRRKINEIFSLSEVSSFFGKVTWKKGGKFASSRSQAFFPGVPWWRWWPCKSQFIHLSKCFLWCRPAFLAILLSLHLASDLRICAFDRSSGLRAVITNQGSVAHKGAVSRNQDCHNALILIPI